MCYKNAELTRSHKVYLKFAILAKQVVEGFITGMHKSPFHGFSAEFAEHKIYNQGESTKHIDWKLFAKQISFIQNVMKKKPIYVVI